MFVQAVSHQSATTGKLPPLHVTAVHGGATLVHFSIIRDRHRMCTGPWMLSRHFSSAAVDHHIGNRLFPDVFCSKILSRTPGSNLT
jgi:hypothetical protein